MRKLIKKTLLVVVLMISVNVGTGLWLQHQVTLSLTTESALQHVEVDLALMMASEARMERSMTELGGNAKEIFAQSMAQVIQINYPPLSFCCSGGLEVQAFNSDCDRRVDFRLLSNV